MREKIEIFCNSLRDSEACAIGDQLGRLAPKRSPVTESVF
ncbi:hypothetical protein COO91_08628 [Nostoc flagelliforme CCNUN1]|uniref:Uncharacterized protein n=1 Tax=Nostoc flagelliforme CCNUN1 TaxID=2038116 RepID=A0A2K8T461_9NOSO|nr:hypothetical protein COO91_08628 [Nostoc flagelliforme CCNUN1]